MPCFLPLRSSNNFSALVTWKELRFKILLKAEKDISKNENHRSFSITNSLDKII